MGHLEGNFTPVLYIWDARFLKVNGTCTGRKIHVTVVLEHPKTPML